MPERMRGRGYCRCGRLHPQASRGNCARSHRLFVGNDHSCPDMPERTDQIARLALYAPLYGEDNIAWLERIADPCDRRRLAPTYGAYRLITLSDLVRRWDDELPTRDSSLFREDGIPELVFEALASLDPLSTSRNPPAFRCPNGALADMVTTFNGQPLYEAARLTMPTLLLRGAEDATSTEIGCTPLVRGHCLALEGLSSYVAWVPFFVYRKNSRKTERAAPRIFQADLIAAGKR